MSRRGRYPLVDLELALADRPRPNPLVVLWRWRYEIGAVVAIGLGTRAAIRTGTAALGAVVGVVVAAGLVMWPPARRVLTVRAWCVVTPHRIRAACAQAWIHPRSGRLPVVLWTSPRPYGERVTLWCRAGTTAADLGAQTAMLATACWAERVEVRPDARHRQLVVLRVIRHGAELARPARFGVPGEAPGERRVHVLPPPGAA
jgi:hypothetical protein